MGPGAGNGFAVDPERLRQAGGRVQAGAAMVAGATSTARALLSVVGGVAGGPRVAEALAGFERELTVRAEALTEALRGGAAALARAADEAEAVDRAAAATLPAGPLLGVPGIREVLG